MNVAAGPLCGVPLMMIISGGKSLPAGFEDGSAIDLQRALALGGGGKGVFKGGN
jgi:hypothetical protein